MFIFQGIKSNHHKSVINLCGTNEYFTSVENTKLLFSDVLCETLYELDFKGLDVDDIPFTADVIDFHYTFQRLTDENYQNLHLDIKFFDTLKTKQAPPSHRGFQTHDYQSVLKTLFIYFQ